MVPFRSPQFRHTFESGISSGLSANWNIGAENSSTGVYQPFNSCICQSFCRMNIKLLLGDKQYLIPPNSTVTIPSFGINNVTVVNMGSEATDGEINITVWNDLTADMCLISQVTGIPIEKVMRGEY